MIIPPKDISCKCCANCINVELDSLVNSILIEKAVTAQFILLDDFACRETRLHSADWFQRMITSGSKKQDVTFQAALLIQNPLHFQRSLHWSHLFIFQFLHYIKS